MSDPYNKARDFEAFFEYSPIGMALTGLDGCWLKVNRALCDFLGYSEAEFLNSTFKSMTHEDDLPIDLELISQLIAGKRKTYQREKRYYRKNGQIVWVAISVALVRSKNSQPEYLIAQMLDITEKVKIADKLQIAKDRYERAVRGSAVGLWDWDIKTDEIYWSPRIKEIVGMSKNAVMPSLKGLEEFIHPDDRANRRKAFKNHIDKNKPFDFEYRLKHRKKGHYIWLHTRGKAFRDDKGRAIGMAGSVDDITERKNAENELKKSEERFSLLVRGTRDGIWDWPDLAKDEQFWSPRWYSLLGYREGEIESRASIFTKMLHPDDKELVMSFGKANPKQTPYFDMEYRLLTKDGLYKWFQGRGIMLEKEGIVRMTGSLTDINKRKETEETLEEYNRELESINEDLKLFTYTASHDLKEPIRGVFNNAFFLQEDYKDVLDEDALKKLGRISHLCERMEKMINELLNYEELKNRDLIIKRIDLTNIMTDIQNTMESMLESSNVELKLPNKLPKAICDEVAITEVFHNLISNAIKYNESHKKIIEINYKKIVDEDDIPKHVFYVSDNGVGIREEDFDTIFRIFKRLDDTKEIVKGTGMGLSFVERIIKRHGGKIWLESELGKGTSFYFTLN